jgi:hypothetical protein
MLLLAVAVIWSAETRRRTPNYANGKHQQRDFAFALGNK